MENFPRIDIDTIEKNAASHARVIKRVMDELMFPLDDFSEIISSRFKRHLRRLGVPPQQMKKLTHRGTIIPPNEFIVFFELHVRQIQFKIGIRTREDLDDKYLTENVGYYFRVEKVAFVLNEIHMRTPHDYPCYSNNTQQVAFASGRT